MIRRRTAANASEASASSNVSPNDGQTRPRDHTNNGTADNLDVKTLVIGSASNMTTIVIAKQPRLLSIDKVPEWYGDNPYIWTGYRPVFEAARPCFRSWLYLHNQTGNIYTHLVPGVAAAVANIVLSMYLSTHYPGSTLADRIVFHVYLTACTLCFGVSATYHTLLCHSNELADLWIRLDYVCISVLIMASFVPGLYMGFYCEPGLLAGYLSIIFGMGLFNSYLSLRERFGSKDWLRSRLIPFLGLGMSAFIPVIHAAMLFPYDQLQRQSGLNYYYLEGILMVVGVVFLATKFPECWFPGRFDIMGSSHQIFHCFVVLGTISHFIGILSGYDYNYTHPRCGIRQVATEM